MSTKDTSGQESGGQTTNIKREARPELRGYVDVQREADGSPREIALSVGYGGYSDRGPSRSDLALTYRVNDEGTAHISQIEDDTSGRKLHDISIKAFRVLALADDLVGRVPDVVRAERFEDQLAELRETYTAELNKGVPRTGAMSRPTPLSIAATAAVTTRRQGDERDPGHLWRVQSRVGLQWQARAHDVPQLPVSNPG